MKVQKKDSFGNERFGNLDTLTIGRPPQEIYSFCRDTRNLVKIIEDPIKIDPLPNNGLHWEVDGIPGVRFQGNLQLVTDKPGAFLCWADKEQQRFEINIAFKPAGDLGTEVTITALYDPPGGKLGDLVAGVLGIMPEIMTLKALRRLKQKMETGEISTLAGSPSGRSNGG